LSILSFVSVFTVFPVASTFTVNISGPASGTVFTPVRFNATVSGNTTLVIFTWNYGDNTGNNSTGVTNSTYHGYTVKGTYSVKLNASDTTMTTVTASATITIAPIALTILPITGPSSVTIGDTASFSASAGGGTSPYSFSWNFGDGTGNVAGGIANPSSQSHTYTNTGTFTVKANATDANSKLASRSTTIQVFALSELGLDCAYGSSAEGTAFPSSVTTSAPYSGQDFDTTLDSSCQATYLADTDVALHPLVSDNPTAIVAAGAGGGLTVDVVASLNPATTINGFDVSLGYDTKVLAAVLIDQSGLIWGGTGVTPPGFVLTLAKTIDKTNGVIRVAQVLVGAPQQTGDSELFRVRFDLVGASTGTPVTIFNDFLLNPGSVPHSTKSLSSPGVDTTSIYNTLNAGASLNAVANWAFSPNPEVAGSPLTFTASATCPGCTGTLTYTWDFSSSDDPTYVQKSQATGISTTVTAPPPVINRVTLTIRDAANPAESISVTRLLPLVLSEGPSSTILTQGTAGGSWSGQWLGGVTTSSAGYTGSWTFCPGSAIVKTVCSSPIVSILQSGAGVTQTSSSGALTYNFAGLYNATLKIADTPEIQIGTLPAGNTAVSSFLVNVTGSTPAYTVAVGADNISPGVDQIVSFTARASYTSNYPAGFRARSFNYMFNFGDGTPSFTVPFAVLAGQNASATHTYHSSGKFVVKVVAQETGAGVVSQIIENGYLEVGVGIICSAAGSCGFTISPVSPVTGQSLTFNATASGGTSPYAFSWSFGDGSTATGATPNHTYQTAGTYNVTVTITDSAGQTQTVHKTVTVGPGNGGGGGFDFASLLTSPPVLAGIAAAVIIIPTTMLYIMRRRRKSIQPNLS